MASRREEKERRRRERLASEQAETVSSERSRRTVGLVAAGVLGAAAVAAVAVVILAGGGGEGGPGARSGADERQGTAPPPIRDASLKRTARAAGCKLSNPADAGNQHLEPGKKATYKTRPPTSGAHDPVPTEDGAYLDRPEPRHLVHSLEHGRIEIQYRPSLAEERQLKLKGLFDEDPSHMLLFPNADMPYEAAATAWTHLIGCRRFSDKVFDALRAFKDTYRDQGPEFVP